MGRVLQIRVSAVTVSPSDLGWSWSKLAKLAFGHAPSDADKNQGVLEMIDALEDAFLFGDWSGELKEAIREPLEKVVLLRKELAEALADWNPSKANDLSNKIEDALDRLERACPGAR